MFLCKMKNSQQKVHILKDSTFNLLFLAFFFCVYAPAMRCHFFGARWSGIGAGGGGRHCPVCFLLPLPGRPQIEKGEGQTHAFRHIFPDVFGIDDAPFFLCAPAPSTLGAWVPAAPFHSQPFTTMRAHPYFSQAAVLGSYFDPTNAQGRHTAWLSRPCSPRGPHPASSLDPQP